MVTRFLSPPANPRKARGQSWGPESSVTVRRRACPELPKTQRARRGGQAARPGPWLIVQEVKPGSRGHPCRERNLSHQDWASPRAGLAGSRQTRCTHPAVRPGEGGLEAASEAGPLLLMPGPPVWTAQGAVMGEAGLGQEGWVLAE